MKHAIRFSLILLVSLSAMLFESCNGSTETQNALPDDPLVGAIKSALYAENVSIDLDTMDQSRVLVISVEGSTQVLLNQQGSVNNGAKQVLKQLWNDFGQIDLKVTTIKIYFVKDKQYQEVAYDLPQVLALKAQGCQQERPEDALRYLSMAMDRQPNYAAHYNQRSAIRFEIGEYENCLADLDTAMTLGGDSAFNLTNQGNVYLRMEKPEEALKRYQLAVKLNPEIEQGYANQGNAFLQLNMLDSAVSSYRKAVMSVPNDAYHLASMANVYLEIGHTDSAQIFADMANQADPENGKAQFVFARLELLRGDTSLACMYFQNAMEHSYYPARKMQASLCP